MGGAAQVTVFGFCSARALTGAKAHPVQGGNGYLKATRDPVGDSEGTHACHSGRLVAPALWQAHGHVPEPPAPTLPDPPLIPTTRFPTRPGSKQTREPSQAPRPRLPRGVPPLARAGHSCGVTEGQSKASQPRPPP